MIPKPDIALIAPTDTYKQVMVHSRVTLDIEGGLAVDLVKIAMTQPLAPVEGATSEVYRLMSEQELVDRSFEIARLTYQKITERNLWSETPPFDDLRIKDRPTGFTSTEQR